MNTEEIAEGLPDPLVAADVDLRDFSFMPLDVLRLRDSDLSASPNAEVFRCNVLSWCVSWHQIPAASLPDDDTALARLLGFGRDLKGWKKVRTAGGLRGWVKCSDGRLYHPVVADKAREAWSAKVAQRQRTEAARKAREEARQRQLQEMLQSQSQEKGASVTDDVTASKGQGQGQGQGIKKEKSGEPPPPPGKPEAPTKGARLSKDWLLPKAWGEWTLAERKTWSADYVRKVAEKFRDHWIAQPGRDGVKSDWLATWRNWVRREPDPKPGQAESSDFAREWHETAPGIEAKGKELGIDPPSPETGGFPAYKARVYAAAGLHVGAAA